jgi:hypothetical protein
MPEKNLSSEPGKGLEPLAEAQLPIEGELTDEQLQQVLGGCNYVSNATVSSRNGDVVRVESIPT